MTTSTTNDSEVVAAETYGMLSFRAATLLATLAAASLWIANPHGAQAVDVDRSSRDYMLPEQMQWKDPESGMIANLYGDPSRPGLYAYVIKRGPNTWTMSRVHDNDVFVTVLEGTFWVGRACPPEREGGRLAQW